MINKLIPGKNLVIVEKTESDGKSYIEFSEALESCKHVEAYIERIEEEILLSTVTDTDNLMMNRTEHK